MFLQVVVILLKVNNTILFFFSYYLEILHQEFWGAASFNVALFSEKSSFTEAQTDDAVNEVQNIVAQYDVFDDEYVGWP